MYIPIAVIALIIMFVCVSNHMKQQEMEYEKRRLEEEHKREISRLKWEQYQEKEENEKQLLIKEIAQISNFSHSESENVYELLYIYSLLFDFRYAETTDEKIKIVNRALNYSKYYENEILPIIKKANLSINSSHIGHRMDEIEYPLYSDISLENKLKMINSHECSDAIRPNFAFLLDALKEEYEDPYDKFIGNACKIMSEDDFLKIISCFNNFFSLKFNKYDAIELYDMYDLYYDCDSLGTIFSMGLYLSPLTDELMHYISNTPYCNILGLSNEDDYEMFKDYVKYDFCRFADNLFFSIIYYPLSDYYDIVVKNFDLFLDQVIENIRSENTDDSPSL